MKNTDSVHKLIAVLDQAFRELGVDVKSDQVASLANTIDQSMSGEGRYYHTSTHALHLADPKDPVQSLAALFHDVIYVQIDNGFPPGARSILSTYLTEDTQGDNSLRLATGVPSADSSYHLARDIFGFPDGHHLYANGGSNEFLSSLLMAKKLEGFVSKKTLAQIIAYIEATIPFRLRDESGVGPFENLARRLERVAKDNNIPLSPQEIDETVHGAVTLANKDVENFSNGDTASFLDSTWLLLPEFNPALRKGSLYSLRDYRQALQAMEKFLCGINPEAVLHDYKGVPSANKMRQKLQAVRNNLSLGCEYLEIKLVTVAILEALAGISNVDKPISTYLGDVYKNGKEEDDLGNFLPAVEPNAAGVDVDSALYRLLQTGRRGPVDFADEKTSSLALFLYASLGPEKLRILLASAQQMFAGKIKPDEFLCGLEAALLADITTAVAGLAKRRREKVEL